jgi:DNA-binding transcriptional ArsR family regulator
MSDEDNVDHLSAAMRETMAEMQSVTEDLRRESALMNAEVEAERAALRAERDRALDDYAELARDGGAGEAREELQRRVDKDETTWRDVMSGVDTHWSAEEVRAEIVGDARAEVDEIERSEPELAVQYREHAVLRQGDRIGEWD